MNTAELSRSELKLILEGLDSVSERMRSDTFDELRAKGTSARAARVASNDLRDDPEYRTLRRLQVKLIEHLENLPY